MHRRFSNAFRPAFCLVAFLAAGLAWLRAGGPEFAAAIPRTSVEPGSIVEIHAMPGHDVVFVSGGSLAGHRNGMAFAAVRGSEMIGELIVVEASPRYSAMLITSIAPAAVLQPEDTVTVKVRPAEKSGR